ncbi:MAG: membrane protein insertion efficiency factor YidD [Spirochaetaceae bacterium 4572_7]|nr:MAG: membrane protein insertion efficiency factor YidD [Spirochaetaceae bacterium 4572_7]
MKKLLTMVLIIPVKIYQLLISPLLPPRCIYYPTCSTYCIDALKKQGPLKGLLTGTLRILRCSPFFKGGVDPVNKDCSLGGELKKFNQFRRRITNESNK